MARGVFKQYGPGRATQAQATILIDDGFYNFFKVPLAKQNTFIRPIEKGFRRAVVIGVRSIKNRITTVRAVGAGFMRKTVMGTVRVNPLSKNMIIATFGTMAWYDILVHEGLGRHGRQHTLPAKYKPSALQLAIVTPSAKTRKQFYKKSPQVPRPFLVDGIKVAMPSMKEEINKGIRDGFRTIGSKRGTIRHKFEEVLKSGGII